ncbi:Solute carrier family 25 member 35 [Labeo rohita]|uniref:Solute carrier family 25 member 35 n=1 Tax=Labeo rohita TaxID=84645 RepID=A0ABQ8LB44_LABRO|nr:Solute carrier family 25 member 35 [Labeo rohita]
MSSAANDEELWVESIEDSQQQQSQTGEAIHDKSNIFVYQSTCLASKSPCPSGISDWPLPKILEELFKSHILVPSGATHEELFNLLCENVDIQTPLSPSPPPSGKQSVQKRKNFEPASVSATDALKQACGPSSAQISHSTIQNNDPVLSALSIIQASISDMNSRIQALDQCFTKSCSHLLLVSPLLDLDVDEHLSLLNSAWLDVLNETALLKPFKHKPKSAFFSKRAAKSAKATYFSNLILYNQSRPKVLISLINSVFNPPVNTMSVASVALCESFSRFFKDKVAYNSSTELPIPSPLFASWNVLEPVSLQSLKDTIAKLKPSSFSYDVIHPRFLKQIVDSVGPGLVSFFNKCLSTGVKKSEVIVFGLSENMKASDFDLGPLSAFRSSQLWNLCVLLDDTLKFDKQISTVIGSRFYHTPPEKFEILRPEPPFNSTF